MPSRPLRLKGFWSYARHDREHADGLMEELHKVVTWEIGALIGERVDIFLDTAKIRVGAEWERKINDELDAASFLIAIVTPAFLRSRWCCYEVSRFLGKESRPGRDKLVFPIEYESIQSFRGRLRHLLYDPAVLAALDARQMLKFANHRLDDPTTTPVRRVLRKLAADVFEQHFADDCPPVPDSTVPVMVRIEPGSFMRGTTNEELERENVPAQYRGWEQPRDEVTIGKAFELAKFPVTRGEFARFAAEAGYRIPKGAWGWVRGKGWLEADLFDWRDPGFAQADDHPVVCVSHADAERYAAWLSDRTGRRYRLPTEAEWEYACRAGTMTARFWGDCGNGALGFANVADQSLAREWPGKPAPRTFFILNDSYPFTSPVGRFDANPWGLQDMLGNVWEWTQDHWVDNYRLALKDGAKPISLGSDPGLRVVRGGSWNHGPSGVRSAARYRYRAGMRNADTGFRLARTL